MSALGWINAGLELADLFSYGISAGAFEKLYPEDYAVHKVMGEVCEAHPGIKFKPTVFKSPALKNSTTAKFGVVDLNKLNKPEDLLNLERIGFASTLFNKNIFNEINFKCVAMVEPTIKTIQLTYLPDDAVSANFKSTSITHWINPEIPYLYNWFNSQMLIGKFFIVGGKTIFMVPHNQFAYQVGISYKDMAHEHTREAIRNAITSVVEFAEIYQFNNFFSDIRGLHISFKSAGSISGNRAVTGVRNVNNAREKVKQRKTPSERAVLTEILSKFLTLNEINYQNINADYFLFEHISKDDYSVPIRAHISDSNQLILETFTDFSFKEEVDKNSAVTNQYLHWLNLTLGTSNFFLSQSTGQIVCRTGINLDGITNQIHPQLIKNLLDTHVNNSFPYLLGFAYPFLEDAEEILKLVKEDLSEGNFQLTNKTSEPLPVEPVLIENISHAPQATAPKVVNPQTTKPKNYRPIFIIAGVGCSVGCILILCTCAFMMMATILLQPPSF